MSRTEGVTLPRLPTTHARLTSPKSIQPHSARAIPERERHHQRAYSEPHYTAYVGTPRQDVPQHVYHNAAMFDDVFDKEGRLLLSRNTPKFVCPLNTLEYNSLRDPHCRRLFLNNRKLRSHLTGLGLITNDLKVVANTQEQRQKIRAHELLERKEQLLQKIELREQERLERVRHQVGLPQKLKASQAREEERRAQAERIEQRKLEKAVQAEKERLMQRERQQQDESGKLRRMMETARLSEQARRNAARAKQELAEITAYQRQYGKFGHQLAKWHKESDIIHNRMVIMEHTCWVKMRKERFLSHLSESYPPHSSHSLASSPVDVEEATGLEQLLERSSIGDKGKSVEGAVVEESGEGQEKAKEGFTHIPIVVTASEQMSPNQFGEVEREAPSEEVKAKEPPTEVTESDFDIWKESVPAQSEATRAGPVQPVSAATMDAKLAPVELALGPLASGHVEEEEQEEEKEDEEATDARPPAPHVAASAGMIVLSPEQSSLEITQILVDNFSKTDYTQTGFVTTDDFMQVLSSRDFGFQLDETELIALAEQVNVHGNGWVPYMQVAPSIPALLQSVYQQRAEQAMLQFGRYTEEVWCQLYTAEGVTAFFNKFTGVLQYSRPDDFRPSLKDDIFEDSIVDFFETADTNKDGYIDYNDFYALLTSPMVSTRIYSNQMEELLQEFEAHMLDGRMGLVEFAPVAKFLLLMIYQNAYPDVESWIELESRKCGTFWFNKQTGEARLPQSHSDVPIAGAVDSTSEVTSGEMARGKGHEEAYRRLGQKKHRQHHSDGGGEYDSGPSPARPASKGPPPLRRRTSRPKKHSTGSSNPNGAVHAQGRKETAEPTEDSAEPVAVQSEGAGEITRETEERDALPGIVDASLVSVGIVRKGNEEEEPIQMGQTGKLAPIVINTVKDDQLSTEPNGSESNGTAIHMLETRYVGSNSTAQAVNGTVLAREKTVEDD